ncbi:hypothetical protein V6N12_028616 [Hibiscus sabdariffa]|uniref:RNase H type-1 domain-containing protein n=1 Tax=Hibiscus sabdariffa TaxID=183260 RepID=A0ABR2F6C2_9ROSI
MIRPSFASCGGVVRNNNGCWLVGFAKFIGLCSVLDAKLWRAYLGLIEARNMGVRKVVLEMDCLEAVNLFHRLHEGLYNLLLLVHIVLGVNRDWEGAHSVRVS